jgi:hypothetical protein
VPLLPLSVNSREKETRLIDMLTKGVFDAAALSPALPFCIEAADTGSVSLTLQQDKATDILMDSVRAFAKLPEVKPLLASKTPPSLSSTRVEIANFSSVRLPQSFGSALGSFRGSIELIPADALLSKAQLAEQCRSPVPSVLQGPLLFSSPLVTLSLGATISPSGSRGSSVRSSRSSRS